MKKEKAVTHFGGKAKLAAAIGLSPAAISGWGETIPTGWAYRLEAITGGKLKADDDWLAKRGHLINAA